ncbi:MAG: hypothetical protein Q3962_08720 [Corynebacterium sp.]|nr:hypothetical protein [Corynebacterium sp.]
MSYSSLALQLHSEFKGTAHSTFVAEMSQRGICRDEATLLIFAGFAQSHPRLSVLIDASHMHPPTAAKFTALARKLQGKWQMPEVGKVKKAQLDLLAKLTQGLDFSDVNRAFTLLNSRVKSSNQEWEEAQEALKRAEHEERVAAGIPEGAESPAVADFDQFLAGLPEDHDPAPAAEVPTEISSKYFWTTSDLRASFRQDRPGYNTITLSGISDEDMAVFRTSVRRLHSALPPEIQKAPMDVRDGHAAFELFFQSARHATAANKVRINVVVSLDLLATHPEWAISYKDRYMSTHDLEEFARKWGYDTTLSIVDLDGRVISHSTVRFSPEVFRILDEIEIKTCVAPNCKEVQDLESHHKHNYSERPRTNFEDVCPVCRRHHEKLTNGKAALKLFEEYCTSAWIENNQIIIGLTGHPASTRLQAVGKKYGLDPLVPEEFQQLKRKLIALTREKIERDRIDLRSPGTEPA